MLELLFGLYLFIGILAVIFATTNIIYFIIANWEGLKWYWFSKKNDYDKKD